jgi:alkylation response protein AidB-like acyl-CoA dehydrogenase
MRRVQDAGVPAGGSFLFETVGSRRFLSPERFTPEQRQFFATALAFMKGDVLPNAERLEHKDFPLLVSLLRKAGELGLLMASIPPHHGGLGLDEATAMLIGEAGARYGSWSVTYGAHVGIGSLPIVWFGTEEQKRRYLPKVATGEWICAYALSEPGSGSDALGARTVARPSDDGKHWILNGTKQWITNAAFADLFVVFAKVDGDKFSAFLVERNTPGFSVGREEDKIGIRGSSTCALIFEDARLPREALLGEVGKGHRIAFNILNNGRLKLGVSVNGGAKKALEDAVDYARNRKAFGRPILEFPLIREKLARMAALIYANESMSWRSVGLLDERLEGRDRDADGFGAELMAAAEEYAIESSILKVHGTEMLDFVADEALQIHGGYGFVEDYPVARAWRDMRVNRIFEGTNEINRMLVPGMLLKRAAKGLPLQPWISTLADAPLPDLPDPLAAERRAAEGAKRLCGLALGAGVKAFGNKLEERQEVTAAVADAAIEAYAIDSAVARTLHTNPTDPFRAAACRLHAHEAWSRALSAARRAVCASTTGPEQKAVLAALDRAYEFVPYDPAQLREAIVERVVEAGGYPLPY